METRDIPIDNIENDELQVGQQVKSLCEFIKHSDTSITIALQGEWGSGKTSFMKMVERELCTPSLDGKDEYGSIWINTWEFFLEEDFDQMIKKLTFSLFSQMESCLQDNSNEKVKIHLGKEAREYIKSISTLICSAANMDAGTASNLFDQIFTKDRDKTILKKREKFDSFLSNQIQNQNNGITNKAFLIFVDDLDRLDPVKAVTLLEALKNLFELHYCIFVLAIDYDVVRKGVEQKYGDLKIGNRDISQEFFDKLIQVPYMLPVQSYNIRNMVIERLKRIGFLQNMEEQEECIIRIITLATRKNPRAIKRLMNVLHLAELMTGDKNRTTNFRMMELLLMSIQLGFPTVYGMVCQRRILISWLQQNKNKVYQISEWETELYHLDTTLKKAVYQLTVDDKILRSNFYRISELLSIYEDIRRKCKEEGISMEDILGVVSIIGGKIDHTESIYYSGESYDQSSQTQFIQGNYLIEMLDFKQFHKVLDVGCGSGKTTMEIFKKNTKMHIDAIDISPSQIDVAEKSYKGYISTNQDFEGEMHFMLQDAMDINGLNTYDLVFSNATMHWMKDPKKVYQILFNALKEGGTLAVHQGGFGTYKGLHDIVRKAISELGLNENFKDWTFPAFYPTQEEMRRLLEDIGYVDIHIEFICRDEKDNKNLIENFAVASLIYYQEVGLTNLQFEKLKEKYFELCEEGDAEKSSCRLYIMAKKPEEKN